MANELHPDRKVFKISQTRIQTGDYQL